MGTSANDSPHIGDPHTPSGPFARLHLLEQVDKATRDLLSPDEIVMASAALLGQYLDANRCAFADVEDDQDTFNLTGNYLRNARSMVGRYAFHDFSQECLRCMRAGKAYVIDDTETHWSTQDTISVFRSTEIRSVICTPVKRSGIFTAAMAIHCNVPRRWTPEEVVLVQSVANRCWESIVRIRADADTREALEQLDLALEAGHAGVFDWDIQEDRITWSPQLEALYGVSAGTFKGKFDHWSRRVLPEDAKRVLKDFEEAILKRQQDIGFDFRACLPDNSQRWIHGQARFSYRPDGSPQRMIGINVDIHDRRMGELALLQTEKLAAVGRLAASIAHEINNPLEAVTNLLYLARHTADAKTIQSYLEIAETEIARVSAISSQTLRFYKQASTPRSVTAEELFSSTVSIYQGRMGHVQVKLEERYRTDKPVRCFDGEIRQVLSNLITNAIEAMPGGGRLLLRAREGTNWKTLDVDGHGEPTPRHGMLLTVADTGSGIPPAVVNRLYDAFFTTKGSSGNGLGLWVSKEIVDRHEATLSVRSSQRQGRSGTVFTLFLPYNAMVR